MQTQHVPLQHGETPVTFNARVNLARSLRFRVKFLCRIYDNEENFDTRRELLMDIRRTAADFESRIRDLTYLCSENISLAGEMSTLLDDREAILEMMREANPFLLN